MNKQELVREIRNRSGMPQWAIDQVLHTYRDIVLDSLQENPENKVPLPGLGYFKVLHNNAKSGMIAIGVDKGKRWHSVPHDSLKFYTSSGNKYLSLGENNAV